MPRKCAKGTCEPKLPGTIVYDRDGIWRVIYCARCRHAVRSERVGREQAQTMLAGWRHARAARPAATPEAGDGDAR